MPPTFTIVLQNEETGRVLRRVNGLPERTAQKIAAFVDTGAETTRAVVEIMSATRTLGRALEQLAGPRSELPARQRRRRR